MFGFDLLDLLIFFILIGMLIRGFEIGFIRQFLTAVGFIGGLLLGSWLTDLVVKTNSSQDRRTFLTLSITLGTIIIFLAISEVLGIFLKKKISAKKVNRVDSALGSLLGGISTVVAIWLAAAILIKLPYQSLKSEIQQSKIVATIDKALPSAPSVVTRMGTIIDPNGFPQVFVGTEPSPATPVNEPSLAAFQAVINKDSASVVKIEGRGCGGIVLGSGFVAGNGYIITNAHVVAGVSNPYVIDGNGQHNANVVFFDPNLDLAVLQTTDLAGQPLKIDQSLAAIGSQGVVLGYPGGGPFDAVPGAVADEFIATGRNIYNEGSTNREVYELQATVVPGNSGGPFVTTDGNVSGIVFAQSTVYNHVGYALAMQQVVSEFDQAKANPQSVSTGNCAE